MNLDANLRSILKKHRPLHQLHVRFVLDLIANKS